MFLHKQIIEYPNCFQNCSTDVKIAQNRSSKNWNIHTGYGYENGKRQREEFPFRTFNSGTKFGFRVILKVTNRNTDELCAAALQGFDIAFHTPYEMPRFSKVQFHVEPNSSVDLQITPKVFIASKGLRKYKPHQRQCLFRSERKLKFFKIYTRSNCELECLSNLMLRECGCVRFVLPSKPNSGASEDFFSD